jgi:sulfite reductase alpha subunit-like flavoprotein
MAKDVNQCLRNIIMEKLGKLEEEANQYIADLQKEGRFFTDIWF